VSHSHPIKPGQASTLGLVARSSPPIVNVGLLVEAAGLFIPKPLPGPRRRRLRLLRGTGLGNLLPHQGGLHALTRNLALELAPHQIRVNTVAPAVVATPILGT